MIKLFRKKRYDLMEKNKTGKYLKYAVGEILLVVIGILIAISINNWNETQKFKAEALRVIKELNTEFANNRIVLKERINDLENANHNVRAVLSYMNKNRDLIQKINMDSIINNSLYYGNFNPANSTILELISSGKLNLVSNQSLKQNLYKWIQLLGDSDEDFKNQDQQATTQLIPYISKHLSIKNLNTYKDFGVSEESELFNLYYNDVFHDLEFENLYQSKLFWNTTMVNHYKALDRLAIEILKESQYLE